VTVSDTVSGSGSDAVSVFVAGGRAVQCSEWQLRSEI